MKNYDIFSYIFGGDNITTNTTELRSWNIGTPNYSTAVDWIDTDLACPDCGGQMQKQMNVVYTSNPPMYGYKCKVCGAFHYRFC